jgi:mannose-6-phosphate isomerase-like protein (cupin superfamily)
MLVRMTELLNVERVLDAVEQEWSPQVIATVNEYDVKVANVSGDFPEHRHDDTDEFFLVLEGCFELRMQGRTVRLEKGDVYTVRRGLLHAPSASPGTRILMLEPRGTFNTGDATTGTTGARLVE